MGLAGIRDFIKSHGYDFEIGILNSKFQKATDKQGRKVWYIGDTYSDDFTVFTFGDYRDLNKTFTHRSKAALTSLEEARFEKFTEQVSKDKILKQEIMKEMMPGLWERLEDLPNEASDYLNKKSLPRPPGVKVVKSTEDNQKVLMVPLKDAKGELWNIQHIYAGGNKTFHKEAKKKGLFYTFGVTPSTPILIGEGFATCAAAHLATGLTVVCAFDGSNLERAVKSLLSRGVASPDIVLLADHDGATFKKTGKNPGMLAAQKLTKTYHIGYVTPTSFDDERNVDFADIWKSDGGPDKIKEIVSDVNGLFQIMDEVFEVKNDAQEVEEISNFEMGYIKKFEVDETPGLESFQSMRNQHLEKVDTSEKTLTVSFPLPLDEPKMLPLPEPEEFPTKKSGFVITEMKNGKLAETPDFDGFARYLGNQFHLKANDAFTYIYEDEHYKPISMLGLESLAKELLKPNMSPSLIAQFVRAARMQNFIRKESLVEPTGMINLANGILDVRNKHLRPHTPEFFFQYKLPHAYEPGAPCAEWERFLLRTFEGNRELADVCAEIFGYVLLGGEPFLHKAIVFSGEGRNGKSTVLDVLKFVLGRSNFSNIPISNLDKPFSVVMADGKLANIVGETTAQQINSEAFKTACSGEELIAAQKNLPEFPLAFKARIVMACNKLPHLGDATTGAYEKFYILPFNRYITEAERMPLFAKRMLFPEVSGVINWALVGLDRLILRGMLPSIEAVRQQNVELREEIDSVFAWMKDTVRLGDGEVVRVKIKDWYPDYKIWCDEQGRNPVALLQFSKRVMAEVRKLPNFTVTRPQNVVQILGPLVIVGKLNAGKHLPF